MSAEKPGNGRSAFEKRAREALERRKVPLHPTDTIHLPDFSTEQVAKTDEAQVSEAKEISDAEKRYFAVMPGEIPQVPDGGDYVLDPAADPSTLGVFTYEGNILRPVTPAESDYITTVTADASSRRAKGPRRLATLRNTPGGIATQPDATDTPTKPPEPTDTGRDPVSEPGPKIEDAPKEPDEKLSADEVRAAINVFNERFVLIQDDLLKIRDEGTTGRLSAELFAEMDRFKALRSTKALTRGDIAGFLGFLTDLESKIEKEPKRAAGESPKPASGADATPETFEQKKARIQGIFDDLKNAGSITDPDYQQLVQGEIDNARTDRDLDAVDGRLRTHAPWSLPQDDGIQAAQDAGVRNQRDQGPRNGPRRPISIRSNLIVKKHRAGVLSRCCIRRMPRDWKRLRRM